MRTTVDLPDDLMRKAKSRSAQRGETLKQMFVRLVEKEVGADSSPAPRRRVSLPLVPAKDEAAIELSNQQIAELLDQDDAEHLTADHLKAQ